MIQNRMLKPSMVPFYFDAMPVWTTVILKTVKKKFVCNITPGKKSNAVIHLGYNQHD